MLQLLDGEKFVRNIHHMRETVNWLASNAMAPLALLLSGSREVVSTVME